MFTVKFPRRYQSSQGPRGFGRELASAALEQGDVVIGTSRNGKSKRIESERMEKGIFKVGDRVNWLYEPRSGYGYVTTVAAVVTKIAPKNVQISYPSGSMIMGYQLKQIGRGGKW
ncbi:MAG: hypothetical protein WB586_02215 [Chthoniobacterales bacterium]